MPNLNLIGQVNKNLDLLVHSHLQTWQIAMVKLVE